IAIGDSGKGYLGTNIEVFGTNYSETVHAEQFAFALARLNAETGVQGLIVSAEPCGHCRQFMLEGGNQHLPIFYQSSHTHQWTETELLELLPSPFTLAYQGHHLFNSPLRTITLETHTNTEDYPLIQKALQMAQRSYTPLTENTWAGVAVRMNNQKMYGGCLLESAAFNPTLPPFQSVLIALLADHQNFSDIEEVVLVEPKAPHFSYAASTQSLLKIISPTARFQVLKGQ
ncbi:MAG: cytidine deaminase, partial [Cyanobacteria bacterium]|nr:cytidine deaminase [Cyanobacteriota bacterium]